MGASNSHEYEQATPPRTEGIRTLNIDPRSPTQDIARTPIVVEKTPEGALSGPVDPRSPTVGIVRTPLSHFAQQEKETVTDIPVFPKIDIDTDLPPSPPSNTDEFEADDPLLNPLSVQDMHDLSLHDLPISESTRLVPLDDGKASTDEPEKIKQKKKPRSTQPKELFPTKKAPALKDTTRSPLSSRNVDMNSPLHIVQRKQMKDIDIKRTCAQENAMSRFIVKDKENV